jgi:hypothetical protein
MNTTQIIVEALLLGIEIEDVSLFVSAESK